MSFKQIFIKNAIRNINGYKYFFINTIPAILMFFLTCAPVYHPLIVMNPNKYEVSIILSCKEAVFFISIFFIYFSMKQFLSFRTREFGIYKVLGMNKYNIYTVIFIENTIIGLISITVASIIGLVFFKFFIIIIAHVLKSKDLEYYLPIKGLIHTILRYIILFQVLPIILGRRIVKKNSFLLMKTEFEEYSIIRYKGFWIAMFLLLIALVITINGVYDVSNITFLVTAILGISINYVLFNKIIYVFIDYLIDYKKFYKESFVILINSIRSLIYSIKNILFISTLLISMALVFISVSLMLTTALRDILEKEVPFLYSINVRDEDRGAKVEQYIEGALIDKGYEYKKLKYKMKYIDEIGLISNSEYNAICHISGNKKISLGDKEVKILNFFSEEQRLKKEEDINIQGISLKISGEIIFTPIRFGERDNYVISDSTYSKIIGQNGYFIGYDSKQWWKISSIDNVIVEQVKGIMRDDGFIFSRGKRYTEENRNNLLTLGLLGLVALMLYFMSTTLILSKFCNMIINRKRRYLDLLSIGLSFKELKLLISREIVMIFLISHGIAFINISVVLSFLMKAFQVKPLLDIVMSLIVIFIINIAVYFIWRYLNLEIIFKDIVSSEEFYE